MFNVFKQRQQAPNSPLSACNWPRRFSQVFVLSCQLTALTWVTAIPFTSAANALDDVPPAELVATVEPQRLQFVPSTHDFVAASTMRTETMAALRAADKPLVPKGHVQNGASGTVLDLAIILASILAISLTVPLGFSRFFRTPVSSHRRSDAGSPARNFEKECRSKLAEVQDCWGVASAAVLQLDANHPLRALLEKELSSIGWRLSMYPRMEPAKAGALTNGHTKDYWRVLNSEITRALRELRRVRVTAEAGRESIGTQSSLPQMPKTIEDAYFVLGVNAEVTDDTLKRLVRALRQCWHPDLAQNEKEKDYREARIRQINVANDLISGRWQSQF
jgi:hypothetical protein